MHKTFLSTLLVGLLTVVGVSSVWAARTEGPWTEVKYNYLARSSSTTTALCYNNLNGTKMSQLVDFHAWNNGDTDGLGFSAGNITSQSQDMFVYSILSNTQNGVESYSKKIYTWPYKLRWNSASDPATNPYVKNYIYNFYNLNAAETTPITFSSSNNGAYCKYINGAQSDASSYELSGTATITFDNSTGSTTQAVTTYLMLAAETVHTTAGNNNLDQRWWFGCVKSQGNLTYSTTYYYKYFTFKKNDGTDTQVGSKVTIENSGTLTTPTNPERVGYAFTGWNTAADGTGTAYTNGQAITATSSDKGEITLYAQWSQNPVVLDQAVDNSSVISYAATTYSEPIAVSLSRSQFAGGMYNTVCFPFAMTAAQIETAFGADCEVQSLSSSQIQGNDLHINFEQVTAMEAGKPYLIMPASDISVSSISGVTVSATAPVDVETTNATFKGLFSPSAAFTAGDQHILFVTSGNTLNYPSNNGSIAGMRAYLLLTGDAVAKTPTRCLLNADGKNTPTAIETSSHLGEGRGEAFKLIERGQVILIINGEKYNVHGVKL